jgi:hypothetical protein
LIRAGLLAGGVVNDALAFFSLGLLISGLKGSGSAVSTGTLASLIAPPLRLFSSRE